MVKALAVRELVKPGLLLDHSLRSLNSWSYGGSCSGSTFNYPG